MMSTFANLALVAALLGGAPAKDTRPALRLDPLALGVDVGTQVGFYADVATLTWRNVMLVPLRAQLDLVGFNPLGGLRIVAGSALSFGGPGDQRVSHWGTLGAAVTYQQTWGPSTQKDPTKVVGFQVVAGYEYRIRFGAHKRKFWGMRAYLGAVVVRDVRPKIVTCEDDAWLCTEASPRFESACPLVGGLAVFVGFR